MFIGQPIAANLVFDDAVKVMDVKVFIPFAFGVPQHGDFDSLHVLQRDTADSPPSGQRTARLIQTIFAAQRQVHRRLRFDGNPGG